MKLNTGWEVLVPYAGHDQQGQIKGRQGKAYPNNCVIPNVSLQNKKLPNCDGKFINTNLAASYFLKFDFRNKNI